MPLSVLDAYLDLLAATRCRQPEDLDVTNLQFHLFPSLFYSKLEATGKAYNFLQFASFLDKRYKSCKSVTENSLLLFLTPQFQVIVFVVSDREINIYDTLEGREFPKDLRYLEAFVNDYLENYGQHAPAIQRDKRAWKVVPAQTPKDSLPFLGINTLRCLDLLTIHKTQMTHQLSAHEPASDFGIFYLLQLLSGKILNL